MLSLQGGSKRDDWLECTIDVTFESRNKVVQKEREMVSGIEATINVIPSNRSNSWISLHFIFSWPEVQRILTVSCFT